MKNELTFPLRIKEEIMIKLRKLAESNNNSVNTEIIHIIKEALKKFEKE